RDPKLRKLIWTYHVNQQDDIRRMYINMGPYQPKLEESWKRINNGERCYSHHTKAMLKWGGLKNASQHIDRVMNAQSSQQILQNRLWLQTSIEAVKWLAKQACAFRGHDESIKSSNSGNFIEMIKYSARMNKDIVDAVLENASGNAKYTSSDIQKELLNIISNRVRQKIREEIGDAKFSNQICSLQRPGATRWSSHFTSVSRLISMFGVVHEYLEKMICNGSNNDIRGEAKSVYDAMSTFTFVFILHLMNKVLGISDLLCQALQMKSQDILNAIPLISATKSLLQSLWENGWDTFIKSVISFCESRHIDVPGMNDRHMKGMMHSCQQKGYVTVEHYYRIDLFNVIIDFQLMKLNNKFIDQMMGLLTLSSALNLVDSFKSFNVNDIFIMFQIDVLRLVEFPCISSVFELCQKLVQTRKSQIYFLINRLISLVLTLLVLTTTTERAFSTMKIIKTPL
ncbi:hypothetical protein CICLE_v10003305mg, partial [Citrus x clementina]